MSRGTVGAAARTLWRSARRLRGRTLVLRVGDPEPSDPDERAA